MLESFLRMLQAFKTATLRKKDSNTGVFLQFLRIFYERFITEHLRLLLLTISGFQPATLFKNRARILQIFYENLLTAKLNDTKQLLSSGYP